MVRTIFGNMKYEEFKKLPKEERKLIRLEPFDLESFSKGRKIFTKFYAIEGNVSKDKFNPIIIKKEVDTTNEKELKALEACKVEHILDKLISKNDYKIFKNGLKNIFICLGKNYTKTETK